MADPEKSFLEQEKVTLRRLLTHTAGMTVHGFPGYAQKGKFPTIKQVLSGKGNTDPVEVDTVPGSIWRYSGGGYTVMEKVVEDISGRPFEEYLEQEVLRPMGMETSTYAQPLPEALHPIASAAYDSKGELIEGLWHNYPEQAAAGLWTTPSELARYALHIQGILKGEAGILQKETVEAMLSKHQNDWGLGPSLHREGDSLLFGHGGKNAGFSNNFLAFAHRGDAVIVMTNGDNGVDLMNEIMRSVSQQYGWDVMKPEVVETISLERDQLEPWLGRYKLNREVPGIGEYFIEISLEGDKLRVDDPNDGEVSLLTPLKPDSFVDLRNADEVEFSVEGEQVGCLWNGYFQFYKVSQ
jgi:CubicO group peptidase (beta-lactamase class C family)